MLDPLFEVLNNNMADFKEMQAAALISWPGGQKFSNWS